MATIELHFLHGKLHVRFGVIKDMPIYVYNGFVELEDAKQVYHFRTKLAFPVYKLSFGACADAISLALHEATSFAKELIVRPEPFQNFDNLDRGVFIYNYFR